MEVRLERVLFSTSILSSPHKGMFGNTENILEGTCTSTKWWHECVGYLAMLSILQMVGKCCTMKKCSTQNTNNAPVEIHWKT